MPNYLDNYNRWLTSDKPADVDFDGKVTTVGAGYHVFEKALEA